MYDTETGNIDVVYNGSFLFSSYDMQGFSSELNPIIYTTKDIPYYYYEKDETTGEWIATADENKNIVNEVITDSEGNEISNEIVGSSDSVANTPWNRFVSVIKSIPDAILNGIKSLFVPDDTYFSEHFERLKTALYNRLPITSYLSIIETFKDVVSGELSPITIELYGTTHTIVDFSYFNEHKATINNWVRGFVYFFLVLYNIGQIYKLIRGDTLTGNALQFGQNKKG